MKKAIKLGVGFVTGRNNVCHIINDTYQGLLKQVAKYDTPIEITFFILYDLTYQFTTRIDFYGIIPAVYKDIKIKYITPEDIEEEKKILTAKDILTEKEANLFFGHGHAKGRNSLMYFAKKRGIDYLYFWDDDEYPVACLKNEDEKVVRWKEQNNLLVHLKYIKDNDVTSGYHCGYISPIPYVELDEDVDEANFKCFIEALGNDIISWDSIKEKFVKNNGVTYADEKLSNEEGAYEIESDGVGKWIAGSTLCLNLRHIDQIPAFYNPEGARGEDTFFATRLNDSKVMKVPVYHFHDGFLKYTNILKNDYPKKLRKIMSSDENIEHRFLRASIGWVRYKPLLEYIKNKKGYRKSMDDTYRKLEIGLKEVNKLFDDDEFDVLLKELKKYDEGVEKHYKEYLETNEVWDKLKTAYIG